MKPRIEGLQTMAIAETTLFSNVTTLHADQHCAGRRCETYVSVQQCHSHGWGRPGGGEGCKKIATKRP